MTRLSASILLTLGVLASPAVASASPPGRAERCVAAAERGQQERDRAAFVEARASLRACAADECPALVRKDCAQWLADVETNIPSVVVGAKDARGNDVLGAHVLVDGTSYQEEIDSGRPISLDPGPHTFRFEHPPDAPVELTLVVRTGERNRPIYGTFASAAAGPTPTAPAPAAPGPPLTTTAPAPSESSRSSHPAHISTWAYALGAVALAGGMSFAIFGATGLAEKSQIRAQCGDTCSDAQVEPLKVKYITADVSLGIGVIAAAISTWLFLHPSVADGEPATSLSLAPTRQGASLSLLRTF